MKNAEGKDIDFSPVFTLCCMGKVGQPVENAGLFPAERIEGGH